ncbi:deoxyribonuclease [Common bottlenose dolphin gammaherpesvirus 1 strain Sarasota]|uniref:Deoxyribonuclease n=1 Tax=Common bottlenose dolphin gammaherpesvirus 1 strain Sarasota TaxID=2022783 RepID=A0A1Z1NEG6_9GAMA|nr:deoxyribonuclease [Common bottlenose dolphin gammaherpesvirus 1 strain Sarasota]ARW78100.1 deoxyribonuclease [Common bottlenose dolphin gammaherpesvirus 1 strain Sarasota]
MEINLFDAQPLCHLVGHLTVEEQLEAIRLCTFSKFLKSREMVQFMSTMPSMPEMPAVRFVYMYYLFNKIGEFIGDVRLCGFLNKIIKENPSDEAAPVSSERGPQLGRVYAACRGLRPAQKATLGLILESMTRGQHENVVWDLIRDGTVSSSKFFKTLKKQIKPKNIFEPWHIENNHYVASAVAFGLRCENVVKNTICQLIHPRKVSVPQLGFMLSPMDGLFGVSPDLCLNASLRDDGTVNFRPDCEIFEIKCRFKYLFSKSEFDPLYPLYQKLFNDPCKQTLINFIGGISKPAVEFVPEGRIPSENDYLLTFDNDWNLKPQRKRKMCALHQAIQHAIKYNSAAESSVYLFTDPHDTNGRVDIKAHFKASLFINPKHSYFYQILLQYKIITNYIQNNPSPQHLGKPKAFIASAFFRKRHSSDPCTCYIGSEELDASQEIPVALLITPVFLPPTLILDSINKAAEFWKFCAQEEFSPAPWASSTLFASGDITP